MKGEVIELNPDQNPDNLLEDCKGRFENVLIVGIREDGYMDAQSCGLTPAEVVYLLERYKLCIMDS